MGYTFAAALVKKTGAASATRKAIREGFESMGYRKANPEDASLVLPLYHDRKSAWMTIALEMPEDLEAQLEQLRQLSAAMHTPVLYFMNFDSDFLCIAATDGDKIQHTHVGWIDEDDGIMQDSEDLSVFDALLPDEAARTEFRRILAVDHEERVFSEEAAQEMAALFGYTSEALFVDEDAEPFAELGFIHRSQLQAGRGVPEGREQREPLFMPEHAPPVLAAVTMDFVNPTSVTICSRGGKGRGVRILMQAEGYDAADWEAPCICLSNVLNRYCGFAAPEEYEEKVVPKRAVFADGSAGWVAEFPGVPLFRGVNPASPQQKTARAQKCMNAGSYHVWIALYEGRFLNHGPDEPLQAELPDADWREREYPSVREHIDKYVQRTHIWIVPMENPNGWTHHAFPLVQPGPGHVWLQDYVPEDIRERTPKRSVSLNE